MCSGGSFLEFVFRAWWIRQKAYYFVKQTTTTVLLLSLLRWNLLFCMSLIEHLGHTPAIRIYMQIDVVMANNFCHQLPIVHLPVVLHRICVVTHMLMVVQGERWTVLCPPSRVGKVYPLKTGQLWRFLLQPVSVTFHKEPTQLRPPGHIDRVKVPVASSPFILPDRVAYCTQHRTAVLL